MTDLNGKVVLVTGSSRGIGVEIAVAFAGHGAKVVPHGRDTEALAKVRRHRSHSGARETDLRSGRRIGCLRRRQRQPPRSDRGYRRGELAG